LVSYPCSHWMVTCHSSPLYWVCWCLHQTEHICAVSLLIPGNDLRKMHLILNRFHRTFCKLSGHDAFF
jgi:hypothetical protein